MQKVAAPSWRGQLLRLLLPRLRNPGVSHCLPARSDKRLWRSAGNAEIARVQVRLSGVPARRDRRVILSWSPRRCGAGRVAESPRCRHRRLPGAEIFAQELDAATFQAVWRARYRRLFTIVVVQPVRCWMTPSGNRPSRQPQMR